MQSRPLETRPALLRYIISWKQGLMFSRTRPIVKTKAGHQMSKSPLLGLHERRHYPPFNTRGRPVTVCLTPSKFFEFFCFCLCPLAGWFLGSFVGGFTQIHRTDFCRTWMDDGTQPRNRLQSNVGYFTFFNSRTIQCRFSRYVLNIKQKDKMIYLILDEA